MFMTELSEHIQTADWKAEKHVPVIECLDVVKANEIFEVKVSLGREITHPNTTEHHIRWISLYYHGKGDKFPYQVVHTEFTAHGESTDGPNKGSAYAHHEVVASIKIAKPGILHAMAYCNIHGLWESSREIKAE
jgi:superoxide reductase